MFHPALLVAVLLAVKAPDVASRPTVASIRRFDQNAGQWPRDVRFVARTPHGMLVLGAADARLHLRGGDGQSAAIGLRWDAPAKTIDGVDRLAGVSNYLIGSDRERWRSRVAGFRRVRYAEVTPHVDLEFYGAADGFEYDLVVKPGGDPTALALSFDGVSAARVAGDGSIVLDTSAGTFRQHRPVAFQERNGVKMPVDVRYAIDKGRLRFVAGRYDRSRPLVIDPTVDFSTYFGGTSMDRINAVATDPSGNVYVTGTTNSFDFPTLPSASHASFDAYVTKFSPSGSPIYSTFIGGSGVDQAYAIAVRPDGSVYIGGGTISLDFPVSNAFQPTNGDLSGFVTRLSADGASLIFSTHLGGTGADQIEGLALDSGGAAYVTGPTRSGDFPLLNAFRTAPGSSFVAKFTSTGSLAYSTYFGETAGTNLLSPQLGVNLHAIAVDGSGAAYVGGNTTANGLPATPGAYRTTPGDGICQNTDTLVQRPCLDGVVGKLTPSGALAYATYLRGDNESSLAIQPDDVVSGIAVDSQGNAVVSGWTRGDTFPMTPGATGLPCPAGFCAATQVFVTKLNATGTDLVFSALLGGRRTSGQSGTSDIPSTSQWSTPATGITIDSLGQTIVTGWTTSSGLPMVGAQQPVIASGSLFALTANGTVLTPMTGTPGMNIESMAIADDGTQYAIARVDGLYPFMPAQVAKSTDGGATWQFTAAPFASSVSVDREHSNNVYTESHKSTDGGATWTQLGAFLARAPILRPASSTVLYGIPASAGTSLGSVATSVDGGLTWSASSNGIPPLSFPLSGIEIANSSPAVLYAWGPSVNGSLYLSTNGGLSWSTVTTPGLSIIDLAINPLQQATVYVTASSASGDGFWKSTNFGLTWTKTLDTAAGPVLAVSQTAVVARGFYGTYSSNDRGDTWTGFVPLAATRLAANPTGFGPVFAMAAPRRDGFVAAVSPSGALVYQSYLGGLDADQPSGVATTPDGGIVIAGNTLSKNFPTRNAFQSAFAGGNDTDGFITKQGLPHALLDVDTPVDHGTAYVPFTLSGWAIDRGSLAGTGIDSIHVWAFSSSGVPTFVAAATTAGSRPDIAAQYGAQFANAGFSVTVAGLTPDQYTFAAYPHSSVTDSFGPPRVLSVNVALGGFITIDTPAAGSSTIGGGNLGGWAIDRAATTGTGISRVDVWAYPNPGSGQAPVFLGMANYGVARPDVGANYGSHFTNSGFNVTLPPLAPGPYLFVAFPYSSMTNSFQAPATVFATAAAGQPNGSVDIPAGNTTVSGSFTVAGWAIDRAAPSGTGVDAVHVYAFAAGDSTPIFLGISTLGIARSDIGGIFGSRFTPSGFSLTTSLPPGTYDVYTYAHSTVTGFNAVRGVRIVVQ